MNSMLGIVVPVLNDAAALAALLPHLVPLRERGAQLVVVDGGSRPEQYLQTQTLAHAASIRLLKSPPGRAVQMNAGAQALLASHPDVNALWFLHADSHWADAPEPLDQQILHALDHHLWGRFDVQLEGHSRWLPMVSFMMNWRSRWTGIATGDQGLFMRRNTFEQLGGFAPIALMEDIEISRRLRRMGPPACLHQRMMSSGRRWDSHGAWRTILLMWVLRWRYWWGASPDALRRRYYRHQDPSDSESPGPHQTLASGPHQHG